MAKSQSRKPTPPTLMTPTKRLPRLEGDALYAWAQYIQKIQQIFEGKQALAASLLTSQGYEPGKYLLTDDAYIVTPEQARRARQSKAEQTAPTPDPDSPDSES
jgi:hypothetical protein